MEIGAAAGHPGRIARSTPLMASGPWAVSPLVLRRVAAAASAIALCATLALVATGGREPTASEMSWFDPQWSNQAHGVAQAGRAGDRLPSRLQGSLLQMLGQLERVTRTEAPLFRREERAAPTHGGRQEQLAWKPAGMGIHTVVTMLTDEVKTPGMCRQREKITKILEGLLHKLGGRSEVINATDSEAQKAAESALNVWLSVESLYRMSQEKFDETKEAEQFVLHQLEVAKEVEKLTQKDVAKVIQEYPGKKRAIDSEKELVVELIHMVEKIDFGGPSSATKTSPAQLQYIRAKLAALTARKTPMDLKAESEKLAHMKTLVSKFAVLDKLSRAAEGSAAAKGSRRSKLDLHQDVEVTKTAVIKILMELLKEPDFREHLLNLGLKAAHAQLMRDQNKVLAQQKKEAALGEGEDKALSEVATSNLDRSKLAGQKIAKEEAYVNEHKDFLSETDSNTKAVFIIKTILGKISAFCDEKESPGGSAAVSATSSTLAAVPGRAANKAEETLMAAAQAAAEAAWRAGGDR